MSMRPPLYHIVPVVSDNGTLPLYCAVHLTLEYVVFMLERMSDAGRLKEKDTYFESAIYSKPEGVAFYQMHEPIETGDYCLAAP